MIVAPTPGPLKPPKSSGMMSANMVLPLHTVAGEFLGPDIRNEIYRDAGLKYLPGPEDPVRERQVYDVFQNIRENHAGVAKELLRTAGGIAADIVSQYRIPASAKIMLKRLPWPLATWMLGRSAGQNSWTFGGSATFSSSTTSRFELLNNPTARPSGASSPVCHFHAALFEQLFRTLVHPGMSARELDCCGCGSDACRFELDVPKPPNAAVSEKSDTSFVHSGS